eukprot:gene18245-21888_t
MTMEEILASGRNYSFPECRTYDGDTYRVCSGCVPYTYTSENVAYACRDVTQICALSSDRRRRQLSWMDLQEEDAGEDDYSATGGSAFTLQQYGAIFVALASVVASVLSSNPFAVSLQQAVPVMSLILSLVVVMAAGGSYL